MRFLTPFAATQKIIIVLYIYLPVQLSSSLREVRRKIEHHGYSDRQAKTTYLHCTQNIVTNGNSRWRVQIYNFTL